jgi:hypothetical protein
VTILKKRMFLQNFFSWHYFGNLLCLSSYPHHSTILQPKQIAYVRKNKSSFVCCSSARQRHAFDRRHRVLVGKAACHQLSFCKTCVHLRCHVFVLSCQDSLQVWACGPHFWCTRKIPANFFVKGDDCLCPRLPEVWIFSHFTYPNWLKKILVTPWHSGGIYYY